MEKAIAVVLAGGRSSRMGGQPKCLCSLGEERIIDSLLSRLTPQVDEILLNISPDSTLAENIFRHPTHRPAHISVVKDLYSPFSGPLAGIASSMQYLRVANSAVNWLLSVASDTPFIPTDLYSRFLQATTLHNNHVYVAKHNHQQQYVFALWNISLLPQLDAILRSTKKYRMQDILRLLQAVTVDFSNSEENAFFNVNTPQDLIAAHSISAQYKDPSDLPRYR